MKPLTLIALSLLCALSAVVTRSQTRVIDTEVKYLSGTGKDDAVKWDFLCTAGHRSGVWTTIPVPSNWETEGFGEYQYGADRQRATSYPNEQGKYRLNFNVPVRWRNRVVRIVFEGAMTDTEVWINGKSAGPVHQGSFYRFKYDITSLLSFDGPNRLEVTVSKESANASVNRAERQGDYWNFGGIFRPVYLEALPETFVDWSAVDARADGTFAIQLNLAGRLNVALRATAQITDAEGVAAGPRFSAVLERGQTQVELRSNISRPRLWTAETPNLYRVRVTLSHAARSIPIHTVTVRFGFRTFEVRAGDGLYLNGQRVLLKGVNRHSFWPDSGRTLSKQISYDDVKLIKEMNMNAVRMSHYPPDDHFLEACDELGLYVLDELAGWHQSYDTPTGRRLIGQMIRRDVNHPSILFWDNGNEGGWNKENDDEFARWDPQGREVLHPWEKFRRVNTDHYEKFDSHTRLSNGPDIYMPTEFLHGLYDGGIGAGMWDYWELIRKSKVGGGGFFWTLVDECVKRTDQNGKLDCAGNRGPDGIVGPYREREGSFNTVREIWSPVQIAARDKLTASSDLVFDLENRFDFINLASCRFEWGLARFAAADSPSSGHTILRRGQLKGPSVAPHGSGVLTLRLPEDWRRADAFFLTARAPGGESLLTWVWPIDTRRVSFADSGVRSTGKPSARDEGNSIVVSAGRRELHFSKENGMLVRVSLEGQQLPIFNGPRFVAFRRNDRKYDDVSGAALLTQIASHQEGENVVVEVSYSGALRKVRWVVGNDGQVQLEYEYNYSGVVDMIGVQFDSYEKQMRRIRWLGSGPYRVWQNRLQGTTLDVWENEYNDSTPGENWIYPEFKGYFRDWRWASFDTAAGRLSVFNKEPGSYLGVFKPKDGVNGLLDLPDIGIAFLDVIPAMRNKFHTTDEIGPQSQPRHVAGLIKRTLVFKVGPQASPPAGVNDEVRWRQRAGRRPLRRN